MRLLCAYVLAHGRERTPKRRQQRSPVIKTRHFEAMHLVLTRFNRGQSQLPALVAARKTEFASVSRPSLAGQTDRRFRWLLVTDKEAVAGLERERRRKGDEWYRFSWGVDPGRQFVSQQFLDAGLDDWRRVNHVLMTYLDVDDALPIDYMDQVHAWYIRTNHSTPKGICMSKAISWVPDAKERYGLVDVKGAHNHEARGCFASGITAVWTRREILTNAPSLIVGPHYRMRFDFADAYKTLESRVFRVRSVTSVGGKHVRSHLVSDEADAKRYDPADAALLAKVYNIQAADLRILNSYLAKHSIDVAREGVHDKAAQGCNSQYGGSCSRNADVLAKLAAPS